LNIQSKKASQDTKERDAVAYVSIETDGFLSALQHFLLVPQMVLFGASKMCSIFTYIFDSAAVKLQTQSFARLVRETAGDGDI